MNYAPAYIITQGYKFERANTPARALVYRKWLANATAKDRENRLEIVRLFELGRAEAR
jgi:hypothetical protein